TLERSGASPCDTNCASMRAPLSKRTASPRGCPPNVANPGDGRSDCKKCEDRFVHPYGDHAEGPSSRANRVVREKADGLVFRACFPENLVRIVSSHGATACRASCA